MYEIKRVFSSSGCAATYNTEPKKFSFLIDSCISDAFGFLGCCANKVDIEKKEINIYSNCFCMVWLVR